MGQAVASETHRSMEKSLYTDWECQELAEGRESGTQCSTLSQEHLW